MPNAPVRKSARLIDFDYSSPGGYFITICVDRMETRFGHMVDDELRLGAAGELIATLWESTAERFPGLVLDDFVVMPNHLHAVLFLGTDPGRMSSHSLSRIIQAFKSISTIEYGRGVKTGAFPPYHRALWQRSYYDRMLRGDRDVERARQYIELNPHRWIERVQAERDNRIETS